MKSKSISEALSNHNDMEDEDMMESGDMMDKKKKKGMLLIALPISMVLGKRYNREADEPSSEE